MIRHIATDPLCRKYRAPRNVLTRWRFDRNRGRMCRLCALGVPAAKETAT